MTLSSRSLATRTLAHSERCASFTLIELFAVVTLMTIAVGIAVVRLDGYSEDARLRSAGAQVSALVRLARDQARCSGIPRRIEYPEEPGVVVLQAPRRMATAWEWGEPLRFETVARVEVEAVLLESSTAETEAQRRLILSADGRVPPHALVLRAGQHYAVLAIDAAGEGEVLTTSRRPQAGTYALLLLEARSDHAPR